FLAFRFIIKRFDLKTPGREDEVVGDDSGVAATGDDKYLATATAFLAALGGKENIVDLGHCATRLRMEVADTGVIDEEALKRAGAAGTMKPGGTSVQVIYGTSVQFVKTAMDNIMSGQADPVTSTEAAVPERADAASSAGTDTAVATSRLVRLRQPLAGAVVGLSEVPDPTFSGEVMGPGVAIEPSDGEVFAPAAGTVKHLFDTGHAVALELDDGTELLIHIGLDTVKMNGEGFTPLVEIGQHVRAGTALLQVDLDAIRRAGYPTITPIIVLNDTQAQIELV